MTHGNAMTEGSGQAVFAIDRDQSVPLAVHVECAQRPSARRGPLARIPAAPRAAASSAGQAFSPLAESVVEGGDGCRGGGSIFDGESESSRE